MRGKLWLVLDGLEAEELDALAVVTFEDIVSERVSAAGLNVSSIAQGLKLRVRGDEDKLFRIALVARRSARCLISRHSRNCSSERWQNKRKKYTGSLRLTVTVQTTTVRRNERVKSGR